MKEQLQKWWDILSEKIPHKNYTPEQKAGLIKKAAFAACGVCVLAVILLVLALFPIGKVEIAENHSQYTDQQVLDALETSGWTPLLSLTPNRAEQRLLDNLLYLESADVAYVFPNGLRISVKEQEPLYYFYYETQIGGKDHSGWMAVGSDLRIVDAGKEAQDFAARGLVRLAIPSPVLDQAVPGRNGSLHFTRENDDGENAKTEQDFAYVAEFLGFLESSPYASKITCVDLREKFDVSITLESKYRIDFGRVKDKQEFAEKLALAEQILAQANMDPEQKYIVLLDSEGGSVYPAKDMDLDAVE